MRIPYAFTIFCCSLALVGLSCNLPQRTRTFIPPTNERDLCQWDDRFYYSKVYDYCFRYPSDEWRQVQNTGSQAVPDSQFTANTFSVREADTQKPIFILFVTGFGADNRQRMKEQGITIAHDADPYLIGYIIPEDQDAMVGAYAKQVPKMLEHIQVFAPPLGRQ